MDDDDRVVDKDALDILRILRKVSTDELATGLRRLRESGKPAK